MEDFNKEILFAQGGRVFIGFNPEESKILKKCVLYKILDEVLPEVYYRVHKRRREIYEQEIFKIVRYYMKTTYHMKWIFPKGETAAYLLKYSTKKLKHFEFYAPGYKNREFSIGDYKITFYRKDKKSMLFRLGEIAKVVEMFRYITVYCFDDETKERIRLILRRRKLKRILRIKSGIPKWMLKELEKIKKIPEK